MKRITVWLLVVCMLLVSTACKRAAIGPTASDVESVVTTTTATTAFTPVTSMKAYFDKGVFYDKSTQTFVYYLFHKPMRDTGEPAPLLIFLHGKGDTVNENTLGTAGPFVESLLYLENQSAAYSAYTLVPSTPMAFEGNWTTEQLEAFKKLLFDVIDKHNVDPKRVYISGISMGGFTTCQLVNELPPDTFAAAVPLSGSRDLLEPETRYNTAFRIYHVATDDVVNAICSRSLYRVLTAAGHPNAEYIEYPSGSHISPLFSVFVEERDTFFSWLFDQRIP